MAILSNLLSVAPPNGMWEIIIRAFEGFTSNYILAIILLTLIIRLIWAPVDTLNRRMSQKTTANQQKMMPELNKIREKYKQNPQLLKQKENELYKKYNTGTVGSCLFMLVFMGLNLAIFLTLWTGLNNMAAYKIDQNYENLKYDYANVLVLTDKYITDNGNEEFKDYQNLKVVLEDGEEGKQLVLKKVGQEEALATYPYQTKEDLSKLFKEDAPLGEGETIENTANQYIISLIQKYKLSDDPLGEDLTLGQAVQAVAIDYVGQRYDATQEGFLWIKNIWVADSPLQKSMFTYSEFKSKVGTNNLDTVRMYPDSEEDKTTREEFIFTSFMEDLRAEKNQVNGYFILTILCVLITFLSMWLSTRRRKGQPDVPQAGGKAMKIIMPIIFGTFAIFYNSVFAIYMATSQLISTALLPLQMLIVDKWQAHSEKKKEQQKVEVVDYRRKF